jgi:DNA-binding CsgD family transcriptional regulator
MTDDEISSRVRRLTPREARVFLLSGGDLSVQDISDVLGLKPTAVGATRQTVRRKLAAVGVDLNLLLDHPGVRDLARSIAEEAAELLTTERRRNHVLRAAIRELDQAVRRVLTKARALLAASETADEHRRREMEHEAAVINALAGQLAALREAAVEQARTTA